jgi:hypothetical protein
MSESPSAGDWAGAAATLSQSDLVQSRCPLDFASGASAIPAWVAGPRAEDTPRECAWAVADGRRHLRRPPRQRSPRTDSCQRAPRYFPERHLPCATAAESFPTVRRCVVQTCAGSLPRSSGCAASPDCFIAITPPIFSSPLLESIQGEDVAGTGTGIPQSDVSKLRR